MQGITPRGLQTGLAFHMQLFRSRRLLEVSDARSELERQSGGGHDAQPLCEFAMFKTLSAATLRQAVPGGDGVWGQLERADGPVLSSYAAASPASGTVLAM